MPTGIHRWVDNDDKNFLRRRVGNTERTGANLARSSGLPQQGFSCTCYLGCPFYCFLFWKQLKSSGTSTHEEKVEYIKQNALSSKVAVRLKPIGDPATLSAPST